MGLLEFFNISNPFRDGLTCAKEVVGRFGNFNPKDVCVDIEYDSYDTSMFKKMRIRDGMGLVTLDFSASIWFDGNKGSKNNYFAKQIPPDEIIVSPIIQVGFEAFCSNDFHTRRQCSEYAIMFIGGYAAWKIGLYKKLNLKPAHDDLLGDSKTIFVPDSKEVSCIADIENKRIRFSRLIEFITDFSSRISSAISDLGYCERGEVMW